jgi:hypothetical protein
MNVLINRRALVVFAAVLVAWLASGLLQASAAEKSGKPMQICTGKCKKPAAAKHEVKWNFGW